MTGVLMREKRNGGDATETQSWFALPGARPPSVGRDLLRWKMTTSDTTKASEQPACGGIGHGMSERGGTLGMF